MFNKLIRKFSIHNNFSQYNNNKLIGNLTIFITGLYFKTFCTLSSHYVFIHLFILDIITNNMLELSTKQK